MPHLYIHWPFCHSKCHFCDFVALAHHEAYQEQYHRVLCQEIRRYATSVLTHAPIKTIFIGGGTPSLCPLPLMQELFAVLRSSFDCSALEEVTIESNPADINAERLACWRECGIDRLSMGVQCLDDAVLHSLNRWQRVGDVEQALHEAPKYFDTISVDLIMGLPGITSDAWYRTIETVVEWPIRHVSVYFLTIHEKTPLYFAIQDGRVRLNDDDQTTVDMYMQTVKLLEQHGFAQYEISNFAKSGYASKHNMAYWKRRPYKGFGLGAASFDGASRSVNGNNLGRYLASTDGLVPCTTETLSEQQARLELLMLGLRQKEGIDLHDVVYSMDTQKMQNIEETIAVMRSAGLIEQQGSKICLTVKGMALENEIIVRLFSP